MRRAMPRGSVIALMLTLLPGATAHLRADDRATAQRHLDEGDVLRKEAQFDAARERYEKALAGFEQARDTARTVHVRNQLGAVLTRQDKYEEAKVHLQRALEEGQALAGDDRLLVAATYLGLGVVAAAEEDYARSLDYHRQALSIRLELTGKDSADVATSHGNMGNVYLRSKQYDLAISSHAEALRIRKELFGPESPEIAQNYVGLGHAYREKGKLDTSLEYFQLALRNKIKQRGEAHPELAAHYRNIGDVHYRMGNSSKGDLFKGKADALGE